MRQKLLTLSLGLLVAGCLMIAVSETVSSWAAWVGFFFLALALFVAIMGMSRQKQAPAPVVLSASEKEFFRNLLARDGLTQAARQLRHDYPDLSLVQAKSILDTL